MVQPQVKYCLLVLGLGRMEKQDLGSWLGSEIGAGICYKSKRLGLGSGTRTGPEWGLVLGLGLDGAIQGPKRVLGLGTEAELGAGNCCRN